VAFIVNQVKTENKKISQDTAEYLLTLAGDGLLT